MRRLLFTFVAAVSLVLTTGFGFLWWRSYRTSDVWQTSGVGGTRMLVSYAGALHVAQAERGISVASPFLVSGAASGWSRHALTGNEKWGDRYASLSQQINWSAAGFAVVSGHTNATPQIFLNANTGTLNVTTGSASPANVAMGFTTVNTAAAPPAPGTVNLYDANGTGRISGSSITINGGVGGRSGITISGSNATVSGIGGGGGGGGGGGSVAINGGPLLLNSWTVPTTENHLAVVIPYWFPTSACALIPLVWLARSRRHWRDRRRARHGLCRNCGYDLRASTDRCPECGKAIEAAAAA